MFFSKFAWKFWKEVLDLIRELQSMYVHKLYLRDH